MSYVATAVQSIGRIVCVGATGVAGDTSCVEQHVKSGAIDVAGDGKTAHVGAIDVAGDTGCVIQHATSTRPHHQRHHHHHHHRSNSHECRLLSSGSKAANPPITPPEGRKNKCEHQHHSIIKLHLIVLTFF